MDRYQEKEREHERDRQRERQRFEGGVHLGQEGKTTSEAEKPGGHQRLLLHVHHGEVAEVAACLEWTHTRTYRLGPPG